MFEIAGGIILAFVIIGIAGFTFVGIGNWLLGKMSQSSRLD